MSDTYICKMCNKEFETDWSHEEAVEEKEKIFGDIPIEECDVVYDDCFQKLNLA